MPEGNGTPDKWADLVELERRQVADALKDSDPVRIPISAVHDNLDQEVIRVTCDRLKLRLVEHLANVESRHAWVAPFGIAVTTLAALLTSDFKDLLGIGKAVWQALFLLVFLASFGWLVVSWLKLPAAESIDDVVDSLRHPVEPNPIPPAVAQGAAMQGAPQPVTAVMDDSSRAARAGYVVGQRVRHRHFGDGVVTNMDGDALAVRFDSTGETKTMLAGYAPLSRLT